MFFDIALRYDPKARACDLALDENGDLVTDETPVTPMLLSIGLDRRAEPDDTLPTGRSPFLAPAHLSERRGSPSDALDPAGSLSGSHLWLTDREKETEATRLLFAYRLEECLAWAEVETRRPAETEVEWLRAGTLGWRALIDDATLSGKRGI